MTRSRPGRGKGRLPAETTAFIDRETDVAEVKRLLSTARLVTLTGVGGAGKTRLAVRVARELRWAYPDGAWLVDLAPVTDPAWLELTVAEALGIEDQTDRPLPEVVAGYLSGRDLLLVLDNCEHLLDACARFASLALRQAPRLRLLCTSRQPLGMVSEHIWDVLPFPVPRSDGRPPPDGSPRYAALTLFAARAAAVLAGFTLSADNVDTVAEICARLDGLPLAIELAAAQLRVRTIEQLAAGLTDRFRLLVARQATPMHHRTLTANFAWSFALCSAEEQLLWTHLSVFHESFPADAAQFVCGEDLPGPVVVELLSELLDKSVLVRTAGPGPVRYRLLETIRQYGLEQLHATGAEPAATLARRHRDWYLELARRFRAEWFGPGQPEWLQRIGREQGNLRAALDFCLTTPGTAAAGLELATCLAPYWSVRGQIHEGRYWLRRLLDASPEPDPTRAAALLAHGMLGVTRGEPASAKVEAREAFALARSLDDPALLAQAHQLVGMAALLDNDMRAARTALLASLDGHSRLDDGANAVPARLALAMVMLLAGDPAGAAELAEQSRAFCESRGEQWWLCRSLTAAAHAAIRSGDLAGAAEYTRQAMGLARNLGSVLVQALSVERSAWIASEQGDHQRAARLLGAADQMWARLGRKMLGAVFWQRGDEICEAQARSALGDVAFRAEFRRGSALGPDEAVAYALGRPDPAPEAPEPGAEPAPLLTPRERQVAALVAEGLSNRQIAVRLGTSQRTAESHVENILRKLAFTARTQIAAWVVQRHAS
jgi:non-specific serine/threonine protein kinase